MQNLLGRPLQEALDSLPPGTPSPCVLETAAPVHHGQGRQEGTPRIVCCRGNEWIVARFWDQPPREKEDA